MNKHKVVRRGVSLIEMLVVLAIIAGMIALLFPAADRIRASLIDSVTCAVQSKVAVFQV